MKLKAPRGTQDVLPDRSPAWVWLEERFRSVLERYAYREIRTPVFETTELFQRGVGESTDIVQKEMYTFADRKGRSLTLRPEGTASVARAFVEHNLQAGPRPLRVYYMGPMFRYERPQAGRYRQHQQIGAELIGAPGAGADFEVISLLVDLFDAVGLTGLRVLLNSVGDAACRPAYTRALRDYVKGEEAALSEEMRRQLSLNPLRMLDSKDPGMRRMVEGMPSIQDSLCEACLAHQRELTDLLGAAGIDTGLDARLVRGLDYYTRTVFEVQHGGLGAQNAVGGGGRYDGLIEDVGGPAIPAVGFSTGVERILLALDAEGAPVPGAAPPQMMIVMVGGDAERRAGHLLARRLRRRFSVDVDLMDRGLGGQMKAANRTGARLVLIVGEGELSEGRWTLKDMEGGGQESVADENLESHLEKFLGKGS